MVISELSTEARDCAEKEPFEGLAVKQSVCIVTPDVHGLVRNGGIGTATYHQSLYFAENGVDVTLLYAHDMCDSHDRAYWRDYYRERRVDLLYLDEVAKFQYTMFGRQFIERSIMVKKFLAGRKFDCVYFQDWKATGFHTIQAKHVGHGFQDTALAVVVNSPTEWIHETSNLWAEQWDLYHPYVKWCERYCCEHADLLQAPSQYIFDWLEGRGWKLAPNRFVTPIVQIVDPVAAHPAAAPAQRSGADTSSANTLSVGHQPARDEACGMTEPCGGPACASATALQDDKLRLAFFSRLETRKGIEVFCDALEAMADRSRIEKVYFLGREGQISPATHGAAADPAKPVVDERMRRLGLTYEIIDNLDSREAIAYLKSEKLLAIIPSLAETFGLVVYECILHRIPFLCSDIPSFREMAHPDCIFGATAKSLAGKLEKVRASDLAAVNHRVDVEQANRSWLSCLNILQKATTRVVLSDRFPAAPASELRRSRVEAICDAADRLAANGVASEPSPLVSICVPYYNYGKYLPGLIRSLERSTYGHIEVILVNDGSTDKFSNEVFDDCRKQFAGRTNWRFVHKSNGGIGQTRNFAARLATGQYLLFMDADNEAKPHMIEAFVRCMTHSGIDCLTCFLDCFNHTIENPSDATPLEWVYAPIGNAPEIAVFENTYGDANFIIKKDVFFDVGGFKEDRTTSFEDYDFLARLSLQGKSLDVVPEGLLWYRVTREGFSRTTNVVRNHRRVLQAYIENPHRLDQRFLLEHILLPMYYSHNVYRKRPEPAPPNVVIRSPLHPRLESLALKLQRVLGRLLPRGSLRRRALSRLGRLIAPGPHR